MKLASFFLIAVAAGPHPQYQVPEKSHQIYEGKRVSDFLKPWIEPYYECVNREYIQTGTMCGRSSNYQARTAAECLDGNLEGRSPFSKYTAWKDNTYKAIKYHRDYKNVESFLLPPQILGYPIVRIKAFEATFMSTNEFDFSQEFFGITAIARKDKSGLWNVDNDGIIKLNMFPKKVKSTFFAMIEERIELKNTILLTFEYNPSTAGRVQDLCDWTFHRGSQEHDFFTIYADDSQKMINLLKYSINSWLTDNRPDTLLSDVYSSNQQSILDLFPSSFIRESSKEDNNPECLMKDDPLGKDYRGTTNIGKRGAKCLSWSALDDNLKFHPSSGKYPNAGLEENYCRNPDKDSNGPWCFVQIHPEKKFQYCSIPKCEAKLEERKFSHAPEVTSYKETIDIVKERSESVNGAGFSQNAQYNVRKDGTRERYFADITLSPSSTHKPDTTEKMDSLRQKYLDHAAKYTPPTWTPHTTQTARTRILPTTSRTTTRTLPPQTTSERFWKATSRTTTTRRPTTRRTTTTKRTTKMTTKRTTTTRKTTTREKVVDYESYGGSSEITKASDCFDFYFYSDDGVQLTQEECLALIERSK